MSDFKQKDSGRLTWLQPGQYPIVESKSPSNKILEIDEPKQALLLEWQGKRKDIAGDCWYALVDGDVVIAWEDQLMNQPQDA